MATDAILGEKTRHLVRAFSDFVALLEVGAPTEILAQQFDELDRRSREVLKECPEWEADPDRLRPLFGEYQHRLIELVLYLQTRESAH